MPTRDRKIIMASQPSSTDDGRRTYEENVLVLSAPGPVLTVTVQVISPDETVATGDRVTELVTELFVNSTAPALADKTYNFSDAVACPLSFSFGGVDYSFVATFTPNYVDETGDTQAEVEHMLSHGLSMVYLALISETLCFPGSSISDDMPESLLDALRSAFSGSGVPGGSFSIVIGRGSGLGFPFGDSDEDDPDFPFGNLGRSMF